MVLVAEEAALAEVDAVAEVEEAPVEATAFKWEV